MVDISIGKYFDFSFDFDFLELFQSIIERIEDINDDEQISQAIDDELIYYDDQWKVVKFYCNPQDCSWETAINCLFDDVYGYLALMRESQDKHEE